MNRWLSLGMSCVMVLALGVACSDDATENNKGTAGTSGSGAGSSKAGSAGSSAGTAGKGGAPSGSAGGEGAGVGPGPDGQAGAGGDTTEGGRGGEGPSPVGGAGGETVPGGGGEAGSEAASCQSVRTALLGPIDAVSTGLVTLTSEPEAAKITAVVDGSAGGFAAAATNPYIYVSLAGQARVDITDLQADTSTAWDLAFKRDNIRSNSGDSGPGQAQIASLPGAIFDDVTADAATGAEFSQDAFVDPESCEPSTDDTGKPLTAFAGWYDYAPASMTLTPNDRVYLVRAADGTSLFKLQITGYYVDVPNGSGGTVKKSAVFSLTYQAL